MKTPLIRGHEGCELKYYSTTPETGAKCYWCPKHEEWVFMLPVAKVYHYYDGTSAVFKA